MKPRSTLNSNRRPCHSFRAIPQPSFERFQTARPGTNVHSLGVKGDGTTDDTDALEAAIRAHRILYLPTGRYLISRSLALKPDTVLIGLHPSSTQIDLANHTAAFDGPGAPVPLLSTPAGGTNIVSGIGPLRRWRKQPSRRSHVERRQGLAPG